MRLHFIPVPVFDSAAAESALNHFWATHRIVALDRQLIADGARSAWAICVSYVPAEATKDARLPRASPDKRRPDPRRID